MRSIKDIKDFKDKKILLRVDFDVPVSEGGEILESFRIKKQKRTLDYLVNQGAKIVLVAHISDVDVDSFENLIPQLKLLLDKEINFIKDIDSINKYLDNYAGPALMDNVRKWPGEKENDEDFAKRLAENFDLYINNDFAVCHRKHASVSAITSLLPSYAGFLIEEEVLKLKEAVTAPKEGKIVIMGGAKASTKIPVIKNFLDKAEKILLGGVIVNDILKAGGQYINDSVADENSKELLADIDLTDSRLVIPDDFGKLNDKILDIGPNTTEVYKDFIIRATMVIWNGPLGFFEDERFAIGTNSIAESVAALKVPTIIGGGDTITAVDRLGLLDKFYFLSTGGGAMLAFLSGERLPGLEALGYYN